VIALLLALVVAVPLPRVAFRTDLGDFVVEVDEGRAPASARNFLRYVDAGRYRGGAFHRTVNTSPDNQPGKAVKIDVVQAGAAPGKDFPPVALERTRDTGLTHVDGAVSMARDGPDTATSDFFVCVGPQPELDHGGRRNPDGQGFAAFGRVVSGMDVIRRIHAAPARGQSLDPPVRILEAARLRP
jgi:peptidyl-prolyl cis-trans isomerase A (cyclophilin A)